MRDGVKQYPKQLEACGVRFRVMRDGTWENVCFSDLSWDEMEEVLAEKNPEFIISLIRRLWEVYDKFKKDEQERFLARACEDADGLRRYAKAMAGTLYGAADVEWERSFWEGHKTELEKSKKEGEK